MSIVLLGSTSGSCTLQEQAVAGTTTLTLPTVSGTVGILVSGTAVASTSGTSIDFTSIPAGVRRVTVMFSGVSTNGTSSILVQLGAGSVTTTGYVTNASNITTTSANNAAVTTGWSVGRAAASDVIGGQLVLSLLSPNTWVGNGGFAVAASASSFPSGLIALGGTLDRLRITTVSGTDTFDAGSINILYE